MYSRLSIIDIAEANAESRALSDRLRYKKFIEAGEQFISDHRLIVAGESATRLLLLGENSTIKAEMEIESYHYDVYSEHAPKYAKLLANSLYQIDPDGLAHYTIMKTKIPGYLFTIEVDGRELFTITALPTHRGISTANVIIPIPKPAQFATIGDNSPASLLCMGPDVQLIQIYSNLYSPAKAGDWSELLYAEIGLRKLFIEELKTFVRTLGGGVKKNSHTKTISRLILHIRDNYATGPGKIIVGQLAVSILAGREIKNTERLQVVTVNRLEQDADAIVKMGNAIGFNLSWKIDDPKVLTDPRIRRMTVYNGAGAHREPFLDVFNVAAFSILPYISLGNVPVVSGKTPLPSGSAQLPPSIKIGTPFVIMCYRLIDLWTIKILLKMDILTPQQTANIIKAISNDYLDISEFYEYLIGSKLKNKEQLLLPLSNSYIGRFEDISISLKRITQNTSERRFYPYMPASYFKHNPLNADDKSAADSKSRKESKKGRIGQVSNRLSDKKVTPPSLSAIVSPSFIYEKSVSEPWFTFIADGKKVVEGRLNNGEFLKMKAGDFITFTNSIRGKHRKVKTLITKITTYPTFQSYLETETIERCLPGILTVAEGVNIYYQFYSKVDEQKYKIRAITVQVV